MTAETKLAANKGVQADPHLSGSGVGEKLDIPHRLAQVIEHSRSAIEQGTAVLGRLDPPVSTIDQTHADSVLQVGDRSGDGGLPGVQQRRRLVHAACLHNSHQNVKVVQPHPASDTIARLHRVSPVITE
jgi:hypothetical protein